ncbi:hypothetical protein B0H14DRAFT_3882551 [Mycena olivaceomarginata]|nr:hypothetical protein B0H14DRAFT_3882551 [Mycena olivaceomarginata]
MRVRRVREPPGFYSNLLKGQHPVKFKARPRKPPGFYNLGKGRATSASRRDTLSTSRKRPCPRHHSARQPAYRSRFSLSRGEKARVKQLLRDPGFLADCGREKVTHADLLRLLPGNWLNDAVINYYAAAIMQTREKVYIFNSFFWTKLEAAGYVNGDLAKWTKKVDIFDKDIILIPINIGNVHWIVAVINHRLKRIEIHDSAQWDHIDVFRRLRDYLDFEHRNKCNTAFDFTEWEDFTPPETPRQTNNYDCGVFACHLSVISLAPLGHCHLHKLTFQIFDNASYHKSTILGYFRSLPKVERAR